VSGKSNLGVKRVATVMNKKEKRKSRYHNIHRREERGLVVFSLSHKVAKGGTGQMAVQERRGEKKALRRG